MQSWQMVVLVLLAVLVGAALPALLQLWVTLRTARSVLDTGGHRLDRALAEVTGTASRIGHVADELDGSVKRVEIFLTATSNLAGSLQVLSDRIRVASAIGAAVGPAVAAVLRGFRTPANGKGDGSMTERDGSTVLVKRDGFGGGQLLLAFVGGAVAGAIAGLLLAPRSGAETRTKMRDLADLAKDKVARLPKVIHEASAAAKEAFDNGKGRPAR